MCVAQVNLFENNELSDEKKLSNFWCQKAEMRDTYEVIWGSKNRTF